MYSAVRAIFCGRETELNPAPVVVDAVAPPRWSPRSCASVDPCKTPRGPRAAEGEADPS